MGHVVWALCIARDATDDVQDYDFARSREWPRIALTPEPDMTAAIIALFTSLAICALIGWAFVRLLGASATRLRRRQPPERRRAEPTIVFRGPTQEELADVARVRRGGAPSGSIETYFEKGRWKNKVQGSSRAANTHATKTEAAKVGREMARKRRVDHIIKKKDGTTGERTSYGEDRRAVAG
jgi:hypothetical protein